MCMWCIVVSVSFSDCLHIGLICSYGNHYDIMAIVDICTLYNYSE